MMRQKTKFDEPDCAACGGTRKNSRGAPCRPCVANGRRGVWQPRGPVYVAVMRAVEDEFDRQAEYGLQPGLADIGTSIKYALRYGEVPPITYAIGYRDADGGMGMAHGPTPHVAEMLAVEPDPDPEGRKAYIVKFTRPGDDPMAEPLAEPYARWHNGRWQRKPKKDR